MKKLILQLCWANRVSGSEEDNKASYRILRMMSQAKLKDRRHPNGQKSLMHTGGGMTLLFLKIFLDSNEYE